ncbi:hypothetical protein BJ138DRAFT_941128 [Hygrophoropsis aurantiaca]|uniref:Uncharacterized protein n=1 Tax=Hygrophoropsis aurantiaca TaxID=72124 RepID=A0ACB8AE13_9AGAM|nr:hypothetical protein BJ138DRAFT_941128 [Hygrophoropsis aurantiaca]
MLDQSMNAHKVSLDTLPHDILYHIIRSISIQDMLRLQQTSTFFQTLFETRSIWSEAYRTTSLPLHAGPFPHQSTQTLKHALAKTDKVSRNWAPYAPKPKRTRTFNADRFIDARVLAGRWLMGRLIDERSIACVDMDRISKEGELMPQTVMYQCEEGMRISFHECLTTIGLDGHAITISVLHEGPRDENTPIFASSARMSRSSRRMSGSSPRMSASYEAERRPETMKIFKVTGLDGPGPALGFEFMASYPFAWDPRQGGWTCAIASRLLVIAKAAQYGDDETLYIDLESFKTYIVSLPPFRGKCFSPLFVSCATHLLVFRRAKQRLTNTVRHTDTVRNTNTTLDALALPAPNARFHHSALKISHHAQLPFDISETHVLHDPALAPWKHKSHIVLLAKVTPVNTGPNLSVVQVALTDREGNSDDSGLGSITCFVEPLFPYQSQDTIKIGDAQGSASNGSVRALRVRVNPSDFNNGTVDTFVFTLTDNADMLTDNRRCEVVQSTVMEVLRGWYGKQVVEYFDGMRGRLLWRKMYSTAANYSLVDYA